MTALTVVQEIVRLGGQLTVLGDYIEVRAPMAGDGTDIWKLIKRFDGKPDSWSMWYSRTEPAQNREGGVSINVH